MAREMYTMRMDSSHKREADWCSKDVRQFPFIDDDQPNAIGD
jgi:hypothetical protein